MSTSRESAHWLRRETARIIDFGISSLVFLPAGTALGPNVAIVLAIMCYVAYPVVTEWAYGRTVGKFVVGIEVVTHSGSTPRLWQCLVKWLAVIPVRALIACFGFTVYVFVLELMSFSVFFFLLLLHLEYPLFVVITGGCVLLFDACEFFLARFSERRTLHDLLSATSVVTMPEPALPGRGW